jgi:hypothetical protein
MATLSDEKFRALRAAGHTGAMNDMMLQWLQAGGATSPSLSDAWREWLDIKLFTSGDRNTDWFDYLRDQTHTGSLNDMELQFWEAL